jgi:hypothetical protein
MIEWSTTRSTGTSGSMAADLFAQARGHAAHGRQVGQQRHAGEVLQHHARHHERDLVAAVGVGEPVGQLAHMRWRDLGAVAVAQHRFEHDAHGHRQAGDLGELFGQGRQRIELAGFARGRPEGLEGAGKLVGYRFVHGRAPDQFNCLRHCAGHGGLRGLIHVDNLAGHALAYPLGLPSPP